MDYQFSAIMVQDVLEPLRKGVLKQLHKLTHANTLTSWFALLLVKFILLNTFSLLFRQQRERAQMKNAQVSRARVGCRLRQEYIGTSVVSNPANPGKRSATR